MNCIEYAYYYYKYYRCRLIDGTEVIQETYSKSRAANNEDVPRRGPESPAEGHHDIISDVSLCQTSQCFLISCSRDGVVKVWKWSVYVCVWFCLSISINELLSVISNMKVGLNTNCSVVWRIIIYPIMFFLLFQPLSGKNQISAFLFFFLYFISVNKTKRILTACAVPTIIYFDILTSRYKEH